MHLRTAITWYLDGEKLAGETARTITISQGQEEGQHTLTLIVQAGAVYASEDFVFEVVSMPTEGLVAYYPFNGNANDESGNGHDGTLGGDIGHDSPSLTADRFEKANSAYKFDAYREMIKLPANIVDGKSNISLAFWIKAADPNSAMGVITGSNSSRDNEYLFMIHSGGNIYGIIKNQEMYGNTIIADNTWHLFVVTRNSDGSVKYYVDGTLDKSASLPSGNLSISDGGLWLGNEQDSVGGSWDSSQQLKGILDDIRIYSRALSQEEIGVLFSAESGSEGIRTVTGLSPSYTQDTAPTLSWEAVANAVRYEVQFAPTEEGVEYITATSVADTTYTPSSTLVKDQTYYWRVRAVDSDGKRGAWSAVVSLSVGLLFSQTNLNLELIEVKGGSFQMGSTASDAESNESPVHQVTLSDFAISKYEITFEQYDEYCDDTGVSKSSDRGWGRGTRPVIYVTWYDAAKFCNWLSGKDGLTPAYSISGTTVSWDDTANGWRLPTEAEWEYAARGGNASKGYLYAGSDNADEVGWYSSNSGRSTHPVGGKAPNELGLYDMSGNVWEWCWDWHGTYSSGSQSDPKGPASGSYRVDRGGSWYDSAGYLRSAFRGIGSPGNGNYNVGFRLVRREF